MKFPITRETLQAFDPIKEREDKIITDCLDSLCKNFEQSICMNYLNKKFIYNNISYLQRTNEINSEKRFPRFIDKLKEIFIGCNIILDPLNTYIIIDWS